ncbi:hypothetical protein [Silvimonas amylolytica]|uniref:Helix-turn-helix domain-containing protein n=1 Tax=Silvimonas amylolytica TaxID=449663 RepID=A0ABQ2PKN8_9NEIS|nr:hypothetical protein [Silvimonas amylolytica]GGP25863.1 hypothetical protein GCM10010971_16820 [Silvimonas amylolytica]
MNDERPTILDSAAYCSLSFSARALLFELVSQLRTNAHTGDIRNNGDLTTAPGRVQPRGLGDRATVRKAAKELEWAGLIQQTHIGGMHHDPNLYALTWRPLNGSPKLDFGLAGFQMYAYRNAGITKPLKKQKQQVKLSSPHPAN